jgi:hypothetical protein
MGCLTVRLSTRIRPAGIRDADGYRQRIGNLIKVHAEQE